MRFTIKGPFKDNVYSLMRKAGYHFQGKFAEANASSHASAKASANEEKSELIFVRPPKGFPRFHLYLKTEGDDLIISLHLDQKRPIYKGVPAHSAEYEGKLVEEEAERIKKILQTKPI